MLRKRGLRPDCPWRHGVAPGTKGTFSSSSGDSTRRQRPMLVLQKGWCWAPGTVTQEKDATWLPTLRWGPSHPHAHPGVLFLCRRERRAEPTTSPRSPGAARCQHLASHTCAVRLRWPDRRSEVCDLVLQGSRDLLQAEGQLHLLGSGVLLQGIDDLRAGHVRPQAGTGLPRCHHRGRRDFLPHRSTSVCTGRAGAGPQGCSGSPCAPGVRGAV